MSELSVSPWIRSDLKKWMPVAEERFLQKIDRGTCLFQQGDPAKSIFIVKTGRILLSVFSEDGMEKILMFAVKGGIFGEHALAGQQIQPCAAKALVKSLVYVIPIEFFLEQAATSWALQRSITELLLRKEELLIAQIADLSFSDAFRRVASELLYSAEIYGEPSPDGIYIKIPITQEDLGNRIKVTRVTVNKIVRRLQDENIISISGRHFIIRDLAALQKIHEGT